MIILVLIAVTVASQIGAVDPGSSVADALGRSASRSPSGSCVSAIVHELAHAIVARRRGVAVPVVVVYFLGAAASPQLETTRPRDEVAVGPRRSAREPSRSGLVLLGVAVVRRSHRRRTAAAASVGDRSSWARSTWRSGAQPRPGLPARRRSGGPGHRLGADRRPATRAPRRRPRSADAPGWSSPPSVSWRSSLLEPVDGLMIALGGWFLVSTARSMERRADLDALLDGLVVRDVMDRDVRLAAGADDRHVRGPGPRRVGRAGVPGRPRHGAPRAHRGAAAASGPRDRWATVRVEDVMVAPPTLPLLDPGYVAPGRRSTGSPGPASTGCRSWRMAG